MRLQLHAGPADGRRLEIDGARLGDVVEIQLTNGERARYFIDEQHGKELSARHTRIDTPDLPAAVIRIAEGNLTETWSYHPSTGAMIRSETERPARATLSEILASAFLWASIGLSAGLGLLLVWLIMEGLHNWLGTWTAVLLWLAASGAVVGTIHLIAYPEIWRSDR